MESKSFFVALPIELLNLILTILFESSPQSIRSLSLVCKFSELHQIKFFEIYYQGEICSISSIGLRQLGNLMMSAFSNNQFALIHSIVTRIVGESSVDSQEIIQNVLIQIKSKIFYDPSVTRYPSIED